MSGMATVILPPDDRSLEGAKEFPQGSSTVFEYSAPFASLDPFFVGLRGQFAAAAAGLDLLANSVMMISGDPLQPQPTFLVRPSPGGGGGGSVARRGSGAHEKDLLEAFFHEDPRPDLAVRNHIAQLLSLEPKAVQKVVRWGFSWVSPPLSLETNPHRRSQVPKQKMQAEKARKFSFAKEPVDTSAEGNKATSFSKKPLLFTTTSSSVRGRVTPFKRCIQKKRATGVAVLSPCRVRPVL